MADRLDPLPTGTPLTVAAGHTFDQLPAPNMVVVPGGGEPALRAMHDERLLAYLRRASAGLLVGRRATTPNEHIPDHTRGTGAAMSPTGLESVLKARG